jgi:hypothetical protein
MSRTPTSDSAPPRREHPWERARRLSFARWESELRRVPYGHAVPDVVGFVSSIEPPADWEDAGSGRRLFALSALPTGSGATFLVSVPHRTPRPNDGSLVRVSRPLKRVLPVPGSAAGEMLLEARAGVRPAAWEEILPGISPRSVAVVIPTLAELWHLETLVVETLLLPIVGSTPWHGRPAGVDLHLEVDGWPLARQRAFLIDILDLAPDWVTTVRGSARASKTVELVSGARLQRSRAASARPFSIQLRPVSGPPGAPAREGAPPRSTITYGRALVSEFEASLASGTIALLLSSEEASRVPRSHVEVPDAVRTAVWGLHWWTPEAPDNPDWYRWLQDEEPRLRAALGALPGATRESWSGLVDRREFRDRLAQAAIARARLRGAAEVERADLRRIVDAWIRLAERARAWADVGRGPLTRTLDRTEGARTARLRRALERLVQERSEGLSPEEALADLGPGVSILNVENELERLRIRGLLFQDRAGRYRIA